MPCQGADKKSKITKTIKTALPATCLRKESADIPHLSPTEHWIKVYDKTSTKYRAGLSKSYLDYIVPESQSKWEKQRAATFLRKYRESIGSVRVRSDTLSLAYSLMKKQVFLTPNEKQLYGTIFIFYGTL